MVTTLGKPENTALIEQSRSVLVREQCPAGFLQLFPNSADAALITGAHPANFRNMQAVKTNVWREFFR